MRPPQQGGDDDEEEEDRRSNLQYNLEEEKPRFEWDFNLSVLIPSAAAASDAIGAVEFDAGDRFLATGGIARKIRIYLLEKLVDQRGVRVSPQHSAAAACEFYMCTPAKLSSLKWKPGLDSRVIGSGDYDGVVMEHDIERRVPVFERDEHGGRRVWSVDYSGFDMNLGASGSEDGSVQMWDPRCDDGGNCVEAIVPNSSTRSPVCSVEFDPFGGQPILAVGCTDRRIYGYDVRNHLKPVFDLEGHQNAVTYAKFLDSRTLISSAIDGCLMMWNIENGKLIRTYRGHVNRRRFVGLSVWTNGGGGAGGLITCGSENNRVFVYDKRWGQPIWSSGVEPVERPGFVSGLCWRQRTGGDGCMLVAGGSDGALQVFEGRRKSLDN